MPLQQELQRPSPSDPPPKEALGDLRFRALLSAEDWAALPAPIRRRFSKRVAGGDTAVYSGQVVSTRLTHAGWLFAQLARVCGGPLPLSRLSGVPAIVSVTEDMITGGQIWTRLYARRDGFPQIIHSSKRFAGPTGLEEYVGHGVGMALTVHVQEGMLLFRSARYFFRLGGFGFTLPAWLTPGALTVSMPNWATDASASGWSWSIRCSAPSFISKLFSGRSYHDIANSVAACRGSDGIGCLRYSLPS
jgi:hypothetical protein